MKRNARALPPGVGGSSVIRRGIQSARPEDRPLPPYHLGTWDPWVLWSTVVEWALIRIDDLLTPEERRRLQAPRPDLGPFDWAAPRAVVPRTPSSIDGMALVSILEAIRAHEHTLSEAAARSQAGKALTTIVRLLYRRGASGDRVRAFLSDLDQHAMLTELRASGFRSDREPLAVRARGRLHHPVGSGRWALVELEGEEEALAIHEVNRKIDVISGPCGFLAHTRSDDPQRQAILHDVERALERLAITRALFRHHPDRASLLLGMVGLLLPVNRNEHCHYCGSLPPWERHRRLRCELCVVVLKAAEAMRIPDPSMLVAEITRALRADDDARAETVLAELNHAIAHALQRDACSSCGSTRIVLLASHGSFCRTCIEVAAPTQRRWNQPEGP